MVETGSAVLEKKKKNKFPKLQTNKLLKFRNFLRNRRGSESYLKGQKVRGNQRHWKLQKK
jgi:hypothetical protein